MVTIERSPAFIQILLRPPSLWARSLGLPAIFQRAEWTGAYLVQRINDPLEFRHAGLGAGRGAIDKPPVQCASHTRLVRGSVNRGIDRGAAGARLRGSPSGHNGPLQSGRHDLTLEGERRRPGAGHTVQGPCPREHWGDVVGAERAQRAPRHGGQAARPSTRDDHLGPESAGAPALALRAAPGGRGLAAAAVSAGVGGGGVARAQLDAGEARGAGLVTGAAEGPGVLAPVTRAARRAGRACGGAGGPKAGGRRGRAPSEVRGGGGAPAGAGGGAGEGEGAPTEADKYDERGTGTRAGLRVAVQGRGGGVGLTPPPPPL